MGTVLDRIKLERNRRNSAMSGLRKMSQRYELEQGENAKRSQRSAARAERERGQADGH